MRKSLLVAALVLAFAAPAVMAAWRSGPYEGARTKAGPDLRVGKVSFKARSRTIRALTVRFRARCRYNTAQPGADKPDFWERGVARLKVAVKVRRDGSFDRKARAEVDMRRWDSNAREPKLRFRGRLSGRRARGRIALAYGKYDESGHLDYEYNCGSIFGGNRFRASRR